MTRKPRSGSEVNPYDLGALAEDRVLSHGESPMRDDSSYELTLHRRVRHSDKEISDLKNKVGKEAE